MESRPFQSSSSRLLFSSVPSSPQLSLSISKHILNAGSYTALEENNQLRSFWSHHPFHPFTMIQSRGFSTKEKKRTAVTPVTSKLKKIKMKSYSSFKYRFRTMNDGKIRRWRAGKRHNAHLKAEFIKKNVKTGIIHKHLDRNLSETPVSEHLSSFKCGDRQKD